MPLSMLKKIEGLEVKPTMMTLQLVDRSIKIPKGVVEDVLVQVDKFTFPVDFIILDMEEDIEVPLLLGRSFMKIAKVIIDVDGGKLKIRDQKEEVNFKMSEGICNLELRDFNDAKEVLFVTSKLEQVFSCFSPQQMKEEEKAPPSEKNKGRAIKC